MELIFGIQHLRDSENCTFKQVWQNKKNFSAVLTYPALKFCFVLFPFTLVMVFSSVQSQPALQDPMNFSMPVLPANHQLQEPTQTHVHRVILN